MSVERSRIMDMYGDWQPLNVHAEIAKSTANWYGSCSIEWLELAVRDIGAIYPVSGDALPKPLFKAVWLPYPRVWAMVRA